MSLFKPKTYSGQTVTLKEKYRVDAKQAYDGVACVNYDVYLNENHKKIGTCDLRFSIEGSNYYYGHVGYSILEKYRGHHYAREACKVLFTIAKNEFKMKELILTCNPDNIASYKTLEELNGKFVEAIDVPKNHILYLFGEKKKCVFRFELE